MTTTVRAPGHPRLRVATSSGDITITGEPRGDVEVAGGKLSEGDDGTIEVRSKGSSRVRVFCPEGSDLVVGSDSGSLVLRGRLGIVRATAESGDIDAEELAAADLRTQSGSIHVEACDGECRAKTKSGLIEIDEAGSVDASNASGSVRIGFVRASARVRVVSGSVSVGAGGEGPIDLATMSGSVELGLPPGCRPDVDAVSGSGPPEVELERGHDCAVRVRALSGSVEIRPGL